MPIDKTSLPPPFDAQLAGHQFTAKVIKDAFALNVQDGLPLRLQRDPANKYDMFAVQVFWDTDGGENAIGFIDRSTAQFLGQWMDNGVQYSCIVDDVDPTGRARHTLRCLPVKATANSGDDLDV